MSKAVYRPHSHVLVESDTSMLLARECVEALRAIPAGGIIRDVQRFTLRSRVDANGVWFLSSRINSTTVDKHGEEHMVLLVTALLKDFQT